ncbi:MAG: phosphoribosyltransferase family protein [Thermoproteota archaeon]|nr:adenine phosphoribosyltransferase [Candidatus Brockarchaeota archaeon]
MKKASKVDLIKKKMLLSEILSVLKRRYTYKEISDFIGLPPAVLARYAKGHVLPKEERADEIVEKLTKKIPIEEILASSIQKTHQGYYNVTSLIWDIELLRLVSKIVASRFEGLVITKVLTASADGVPLATLIANELGLDLVVAKDRKEAGIEEFVEETFIPSDTAIVRTLYIPKNSIKRSDSILVVDDVIRTGETQLCLMRLVEKTKAKIAGAFFLLAVGNKWRALLEQEEIPFFILLKLP